MHVIQIQFSYMCNATFTQSIHQINDTSRMTSAIMLKHMNYCGYACNSNTIQLYV